MAELGIVLFVAVIAALFLLTYLLSRRYSVGRSRRLEEITREIALRDGNAGTPSGGFLPEFGNSDPSPRDRLREPPEE